MPRHSLSQQQQEGACSAAARRCTACVCVITAPAAVLQLRLRLSLRCAAAPARPCLCPLCLPVLLLINRPVSLSNNITTSSSLLLPARLCVLLLPGRIRLMLCFCRTYSCQGTPSIAGTTTRRGKVSEGCAARPPARCRRAFPARPRSVLPACRLRVRLCVPPARAPAPVAAMPVAAMP